MFSQTVLNNLTLRKEGGSIHKESSPTPLVLFLLQILESPMYIFYGAMCLRAEDFTPLSSPTGLLPRQLGTCHLKQGMLSHEGCPQVHGLWDANKNAPWIKSLRWTRQPCGHPSMESTSNKRLYNAKEMQPRLRPTLQTVLRLRRLSVLCDGSVLICPQEPLGAADRVRREAAVARGKAAAGNCGWRLLRPLGPRQGASPHIPPRSLRRI